MDMDREQIKNKIESIEGEITLADGTVSKFSFGSLGWQQWGATDDRLWRTSGYMSAIESALSEEMALLADEERDFLNDDEESDEEE